VPAEVPRNKKKIIDHLPDQHGSTSKDEEEYIIIYKLALCLHVTY